MAGAYKQEFPPLLQEGLHPMTLAELRALCVGRFPLSARREPIMRSLEAMCFALSSSLVKGEVWVDGSFLTQKIEPDDVDVIVVLPSGVNGTPEQKSVIARVDAQDFKFPIPCDSYTNIQYPEGHKKYWFGEFMRAYWIKQFGFARSLQTMKGIAVIRTPLI